MSLTFEENYVSGVPYTTLPDFSPSGIAWHWTAGATGRRGALGVIDGFVAGRYTVNASYHILFWVEHVIGHSGCRTFAMWIVPPGKAAHSIAPSQVFQLNANKDRAVQQSRFAEVERILGTRRWDPNAACIAVSYCGMPTNLAADLKCATFRADVRELARRLIRYYPPGDRPHFGHGWIQPISRYEMDEVGADFIGTLYASTAPAPAPAPILEPDMIFTNPVVDQYWDTRPDSSSEFLRPDGTLGHFTTRERVRSIAEGVLSADVPGATWLRKDARVRLLDYGPNHEALVVHRYGLDPVASPPRTVGIRSTGGASEAELKAARDRALDQAASAVTALK